MTRRKATTRKVPAATNPARSTSPTSGRRCGHLRSNQPGIAKPARIYDLRSTSISNALASGFTVFETARIAGTSVEMIERHYGAPLDTAHEPARAVEAAE